MDSFGNDFDSATGSVMSRAQLEDQRRKRGECVTCGRKCFQKKLFKSIPITDHGRVLNGRCLNCHPLKENESDAIPAVSRPATSEDLERFNAAQSNLPTSSSSANHAANNLSSGRRSSSRVKTRSQSVRGPPPAFTRSSSARSLPLRRSLTSGDSVSIRSAATASLGLRPSDASECSDVSFTDPTTNANSRLRTISARSGHSSNASSGSGREGGMVEEQFETLDDVVPQPYESNPVESMNIPSRRVSRDASIRSADDELQSRRRQSLHEQETRYHSSAQDFYRRSLQESTSSFRSTDLPPVTNGEEGRLVHESSPRVLNRGGAYIPPPSYTKRPSIPRGSRGGSSHGSIGRGGRVDSSRSLGSASLNSFEDVGSAGYAHTQQPLHAHLQHTSEHERYTPHHSYSSIGFSPHNQRQDREFVSSQSPMERAPYLSEQQTTNYYEPKTQIERSTVPFRNGTKSALSMLQAARSNFVEILNVMRDFPDDVELQMTALHELSEIQLSESDSTVLADIGGVQIIINAMFSFPSDIPLQVAGCRAIWNASGTPRNQLEFVHAQALDIIIQDMEEFQSDCILQEQAMAALANLAALEANLELMMEKHVVRNVVDAMSVHSSRVELLLKGCLVIANLSSHPTTLKPAIMDMGAGRGLVIAMVMHPTAPVLQEKALRGLRNLSANCEPNKIELTNIGSIDAVIGALQIHRDVAGVQEAGAWTLANLASNVNSNALIGECGGIDVLVRALWVHSEQVSVLEWSCRALFTLALNQSNATTILQVGGVEAIINSMQAHVDDSAVIQEMGCAVLSSLAVDEKSKLRIVEEEALDAIVLAMVLYSDDANVQARACEALFQLAIRQNIQAMQASNVVELAQTASEKFPECCGETAHRLLENLEQFASGYTGS